MIAYSWTALLKNFPPLARFAYIQKAYRWNVRRKWRKEVAEIEGGGLDAGGAGSGGGGGDTLENIDLDEAYLDQLEQQV